MNRSNDKNIQINCNLCQNTYTNKNSNLHPCPYCGWFNDYMCTENPDKVIYRNLVSFNKAKKLYKEGKPLRPSLSDFLDGLYFYSEMEFHYKNIGYGLFLIDNEKNELVIDFFEFDKDTIGIFASKEDFIKYAKIGNAFVRDIWDNVDDPKYM